MAAAQGQVTAQTLQLCPLLFRRAFRPVGTLPQGVQLTATDINKLVADGDLER